jgi:hypothetical protein
MKKKRKRKKAHLGPKRRQTRRLGPFRSLPRCGGQSLLGGGDGGGGDRASSWGNEAGGIVLRWWW